MSSSVFTQIVGEVHVDVQRKCWEAARLILESELQRKPKDAEIRDRLRAWAADGMQIGGFRAIEILTQKKREVTT